MDTLSDIAEALVAPKKGILAADESLPTIEKRFTSIGIESTEENRRAYREMLFTTDGIEAFISGVIMFDETLYHKTSDGTSFPALLQSRGIIPGIKVDEGTEAMMDSSEEKVTKGLEGLPPRMPKYYADGARFSKWRAVITIGKGIPTDACINENAKRLSAYARLSQQHGLVPVIEPEVLMDGDHTIDQCQDATSATLRAVFAATKEKGVEHRGLLLKTNMVLSGKACPIQANLDEVAQKTVQTLTETVPGDIGGIVFLSGGQDDILATQRLNGIERLGPHPWQVSFSYSRALLGPALAAWGGKAENVAAAQAAFYKRARLNSEARNGTYTTEMEK